MLPNKNRLRIDWDLYNVQEGELAPESYHGVTAEQWRLLRDREHIKNLSPELRAERDKLILAASALEEVYNEFGDGLDCWDEREAAIAGVKNYMREE